MRKIGNVFVDLSKVWSFEVEELPVLAEENKVRVYLVGPCQVVVECTPEEAEALKDHFCVWE